MESKRFDALTRKLASGQSRRSVLKGLLGISGAAVTAGVSSDPSLAQRSSGSSSRRRSRCADGQDACGTFCCDEGQCNQFENGCCEQGTTPCAENSTGCCAVCAEGMTVCGYDCCADAAQCCDNECCFPGDVCVGEEICCTPDCDGSTCGSDSCGGTCACDVGLTCCGDSSCVQLGTTLNCGFCGDACDQPLSCQVSDSGQCNASIGQCEYQDTCDTNFLCGIEGCERNQSTCHANLIPNGDLRYCELSGTNLFKADLSGANLSGADVSYSNLFGANLAGASLAGADVSYSNLFGANLAGASLAGADVSHSNLANANLSGATLDNVIWAGATCPEISTPVDNNGGTCCAHLNGATPASGC